MNNVGKNDFKSFGNHCYRKIIRCYYYKFFFFFAQQPMSVKACLYPLVGLAFSD